MRRRQRKPGNPKARWRVVVRAVEAAFRSPTGKQQEAYARYCHTLSAAVLIAGRAIPFAADETTPSVCVSSRAGLWRSCCSPGVRYYWRSADMDWPLVILVALGGLVCIGFGWIYLNALSQPGKRGTGRRSE